MSSRKGDKSQAQAEQVNPNTWDLKALAAPQDFTTMVGVKKVLSTVPVRKPHDQEWIRVHPSSEYREDLWCVELKDDRSIHIVHPDFAPQIAENYLSRRTFHLTVTRQKMPFLWPIKLPRADGRKNEWSVTARLAAEQATTKWVCVRSNMHLGAYEFSYSTLILDEPVWPELSLDEIFGIAFRNTPLIDSHDHQVMKLLRGE